MVRRICCRHSACAMLQPAQKGFPESQPGLGPARPKKKEFFIHRQKCAVTSEDMKAGYVFPAACALETKKERTGVGGKWDVG